MKHHPALGTLPVKRAAYVPFVIPALSLATALTAQAATVQNVIDAGSWQAGATWSGGVKPGTTDVVTINDIAGGGFPSLTLNASESVLNVSATANTTLTGLGGGLTLTVGGGLSRFDEHLTLDNLELRALRNLSFPSPEIRFVKDVDLINGAGVSIGDGTLNGQLRFPGLAPQLVTSSDNSGWVTIASTGSLTKAGTSTLTIDSGVKFQSAGSINLSGTMEVLGAGAKSTEITSGFISVTAFNSVFRNQGLMNIQQASFAIGVPGGSSGTLENQGTLEKSSGGSLNFGIGINNSGTFRLSGGPTALGTGGSFTQNGAGAVLDFNGGSLALNGVSSKTLVVNGGQVIGSASGLQFTGVNSIAQFNAGSSLRPGPSGGGVGSIAFPGALNLAGASLWVDIASAVSYDTVTSVGAVTLSANPTLNVNNTGGTYPVNTLFTIVNGSTLSGTFAGLPNNALLANGGQTFRINYIGGSGEITLTAVPESQYFAGAAALGLLGFAAWRRQQKKA